MTPLTAQDAAHAAAQAEQALQAEHAPAIQPALTRIETEIRDAAAAGLFTVTVPPLTVASLTPPQVLALRRILTSRGFALSSGEDGVIQIGWQPPRHQFLTSPGSGVQVLPPAAHLLRE